MKLEEMIKELKENPEKKFKSIPLHGLEASTFAIMIEGKIFFRNKHNDSVSLYYIDLDWEWEEVKEPVSFMKLLQEIKKDRILRFSYKNKAQSYNFEGDLEDFLFEISDTFTNEYIAKILLEGKFYIED